MNVLNFYREFVKENENASYLITYMNIFNTIECIVGQEVCDEHLKRMADFAMLSVLSKDKWIDETASDIALSYKEDFLELK